jgi:hypothetical protein
MSMRATVFTSDAKARWAADWVNWSGYDLFWANLLRDVLPHSQPGEASLQFDSGTGRLEATYRLSRNVPEPARPPDMFALGLDGFRQNGSRTRRGGGRFPKWAITIGAVHDRSRGGGLNSTADARPPRGWPRPRRGLIRLPSTA